MAKRLSSLLSLNTKYLDRGSPEDGRPQGNNPSRPPNSRHASSGENRRKSSSYTSDLSPQPTYARYARKSTSDLRPPSSASPQSAQDGLSPAGWPLPYNPGLPTTVEDEPNTNGSLQPPQQLLKPLPSPTASRPVSKGRSTEDMAAREPSRSRAGSRANSPNRSRPTTPGNEGKLAKRRSWFPGRARGDSTSEVSNPPMPQAWVASPQDKIPYDLSPLLDFQIVPELWNENGDTLVYLHAREAGKGPSFKVNSASFASSRKLAAAAFGPSQNSSVREPSQRESKQRLSTDWQQRSFSDRAHALRSNPPVSPATSRQGSSNRSSSGGGGSINDYFEDAPRKKDIHLCVPLALQTSITTPHTQLTANDIEIMVTIRNIFAFLNGQPLVATARQPTLFSLFLKMADMMHGYEFTNMDGSTLGEEAVMSFKGYIIDFKLADVRVSRERTVEAIVLGEQMKSWDLYNEAFVHAVGKYDEIAKFRSPKLHQISNVTWKRLERANIDLLTRTRTIRTRLDDFDFPSLFAGFANSSTSSESKVVRFKAWKASYMSMRRHVMSFYKQRFGAWPPKARSKKNDFEESGLNRLLLRELYSDFSDLYDVLVDRTSLTTRTADAASEPEPEDPQEPASRALRRMLEEYDRSTPPEQPPVPFDTPLLPSLYTTRRGFDRLDPKKQRKECIKKLRDSEINTALMDSYNRSSMRSTSFLEAFFQYERRSARGKTIDDIADLRHGQWIFMYAVLQALPLLVVDAPGLNYTQGVEYFLCEVPHGSPPWVQEGQIAKQSWYGIVGGTKMVSLPAAIVEHGVDGIYRRSHCWQVAEKWASANEIDHTMSHDQPPHEELLTPVMPSRPNSRIGSRSPNRRTSMALGLEQLPLPAGLAPTGSRPVSQHDPTKNFNAILGVTSEPQGKKGKK